MNSGRFYTADPWLNPYTGTIDNRIRKCISKEKELTGDHSLSEFACGHHYYGLHKTKDQWIFREWAPMPYPFILLELFQNGKKKMISGLENIIQKGDWVISLPENALKHGDLFKLSVHWNGGSGERIPSYATRVVQDEKSKIFSAQVWSPASPYKWEKGDFVSQSRILSCYL